MNRKYSLLTVFIVLVSLLFSPVPGVKAGESQVTWQIVDALPGRISPALQARLDLLQADETFTVIVQLRQQAKLPPGRNVGRAEQSSRVIEALMVTAETTQGPVRNLLDDKKSKGGVKSYIPFWIFNGFSVTATPDAIQELAAHPDVLSITADELDIVPASAPQALSNPEANITLVNAPALWSMGYTGQGVVVASMDSGVSMSHTDLSSRWRGGLNSWYDPYGQHPASPFDSSGHGTWTMGVVLGGDAGGSSIGVAPGAQWIAVKMFNDAGSSTATAIHQGYQWLLDPDGNPATADAPHVVNNSWSFAYPGCNLDFESDLQALRAAGILPVFAAGNGGPGTNTSYSPANNPSAFAVGAINNSSNIYGLSSRGPTTCGGSSGVFPELVAPGVNVNTTDLAGFYTTASGTSLAAPHVAGGLALLLSAFPGLTVSQQESVLLSSAFDLGAAGPDDVYGYGRLDLLAAYNSLAPASTPAPSGVLTTWDPTFTWTGLTEATWYLIEVQTAGGTQVFRKWYTSTQAGCAGGTACSVTATELSLANGDYKWRILDYGAYGYGTNSAFTNFTLNAACRTLTVNINPAGSGTVSSPAPNCGGGYTEGSVIPLTAVSNAGYQFMDWSGGAGGAANPTSVNMNGNQTVTANFKVALTPITPSGALTSWDKVFTWTGLTEATWYLIEVQTAGGTQVFRKWYTSTQAGCAGGTACSVTATELNLANGDYQWRVLDYGVYGYGTNTAFKNFNLNAACHTLTVNIDAPGSGTVNASAPNCGGGYTEGSVVQLTAVANAGYQFKDWTGDASGAVNPTSVTMNGNKTITASFKVALTPAIPSGMLTNWDKTFTWTGLTEATWYLIEVQTAGGTQVFRKWYTSVQAGCAGGTACSVTATELSLANGDYKWRILDYGAYGYGTHTAFKNFTLNLTLACYTLTTNVNPAGTGAVNVPAQNCAGGYMAGTVVQLTAAPNPGYLFKDWSGGLSGTTNPVSIAMDGDKIVTANFKATTVLISPSGALTTWGNTFSWTGITEATWYLLEIYTPDGTQVFRKWYTSDQSGCTGGTACSIAPPETAGLANGDYKWRILDYGAYGYGTWTPYTTFTLNR